jgi:hypothetical protein
MATMRVPLARWERSSRGARGIGSVRANGSIEFSALVRALAGSLAVEEETSSRDELAGANRSRFADVDTN